MMSLMSHLPGFTNSLRHKLTFEGGNDSLQTSVQVELTSTIFLGYMFLDLSLSSSVMLG